MGSGFESRAAHVTDSVVDEDVRRCPVHSEPGADELERWVCPDECQHFLDELERRFTDVTVNGNYVSVTFRRGVMYRREFSNHKPVSRWMPTSNPWRDKMSRMHAAYRRRRSGW